LRKTCGFAQIKTKISFHAQLSQKIFPVLRKLRKKIAQNSLRFMRKNSAKVRKKKNCAKDLAFSWKPYYQGNSRPSFISNFD